MPTPSITEKGGSVMLPNMPRTLERAVDFRSGYALATEDTASTDLKMTTDGKLILIPQPSNSKHDPLNWTTTRKNLILIIVSATSFLPDFSSAIGAVTLIPQAVEFGRTQSGMLSSLVGNLFMLGAGGIIVVPLIAYFGRLPVLFWFIAMAAWSIAWCASPATFEQFAAARILNGFFSTVAQGSGLIFIHDLFFIHEHARKINIWSFCIILSPYLGPMTTAFIINEYKWNWAFWLSTLLHGICLIAIALFCEETYYDRKILDTDQPSKGRRIWRLLGSEQWGSRDKRVTFLNAFMRPVQTICKPVVLISTVYYLFIFAWVVGVNTTLSIFLQPLYGFGPTEIGFFYFTPVVAVVLGELLGQWLHDANATFWMHRNRGILEPEARLWVIWFANPFMITGLALLGFSLENAYHYMICALGWGLYVFGIMISTVGLNAYVLDSYPEGSGEVSAWLNFARTTGGFVITYVQIRWAQTMGPKNSFGIQAAIIGAVFPLIIILQVWGRRLRIWSGKLRF